MPLDDVRLACLVALGFLGCAGSPPTAASEPGEEGSLEACSDLADNDGDGLADCRDPQCGAHERCSDDFDPEQDPDGVAPEPGNPDEPPGDSADPSPDDGDAPEPAPEDLPACEPLACAQAGGTHCCDGECIDYYTDLDNCGACGAECRRGVCAASFCLCTDEWPDLCGQYDDGGHLCTNFATDRDNCGSCGQACAPGQSCCGGSCADAC